jgi:hypothetical protein
VPPPLVPPLPDEPSDIISSNEDPQFGSPLKSGGPSGPAPHPQSDSAAAIPIKKITSEIMAMRSIFAGVMNTDCGLEQ